MTNKTQEAYIRGFCKVAEAYGIDPIALAKYAAPVAAPAAPQAKATAPAAGAATNIKYPRNRTAGDLMNEHPESVYLNNPKTRSLRNALLAVKNSPTGHSASSGLPMSYAEHPMFEEPVGRARGYINNSEWSPAASNNLIRAGWKFPKAAPQAATPAAAANPNIKYPSNRTGWDLMDEPTNSAYLNNPKTRSLRDALLALRRSPTGHSASSGLPMSYAEHPMFEEPAVRARGYINNSEWSPAASNNLIRAGWKFPR